MIQGKGPESVPMSRTPENRFPAGIPEAVRTIVDDRIRFKPLIIRADASLAIGSGHVMRCLALAEAWKDGGGQVIFVLSAPLPHLEKRLSAEAEESHYLSGEPGSSEDARETARIARMHLNSWVVIDGYHFGAEYQKILRQAGLSSVVIDDYGHADRYYADIILNQNSYADMSFYRHYEPGTRFLLGAEYALLRREFLCRTGYKRTIPATGRNVLVTFGGADPENVTLAVIEALKQVRVDHLQVIAVVGGMNPHFEELVHCVANHPNFSILKNVSNMPELMMWADIAISAGGTTCWELAFMGLPSILYPIADNQQPNVTDLIEKKMAISFGVGQGSESPCMADTITDLLCSKKLRTFLHKNLKNLVDGNGCLRLITNMERDCFSLRPVDKRDCRQIWKWANDPIVRNMSFHPAYIPWSDHRTWFEEKISNPRCSIFILTDWQERAVGQIRFDILDGEAEVDVSIDRSLRGCGLGSYIIKEGVKKFYELTKIPHIHAYVRTTNISSLHSFEHANFTLTGNTSVSGYPVYHLVWERS
jgi:UDP-2,4-diacetamido-2,4,6-trideoxy-beta-L-altropyranose hydrolase